MRLAGKELSWYVTPVKWPVIILAAWSIAGAVFLQTSPDQYMDIFGNRWLSILPFILYFIAGYLAAADHKATSKQAAWAGAVTGIVIGLLGIVILAVSFSSLLQLSVDEAISAAAEQGQAVDAATIMPLVKIGMYVSAALGPVFAGLVGALFGWLGYLSARKIEGESKA